MLDRTRPNTKDNLHLQIKAGAKSLSSYLKSQFLSAEAVSNNLKGILVTILAVSLCTAVGLIVSTRMNHKVVLPIYILTVFFVSTRFGYLPALMSCFASILAYDYFFESPIYSILTMDYSISITFLVMLLMSVLISHRTLTLKLLNKNLEEIVNSRTKELSDTNIYLSNEIEKKTALEKQLRGALETIAESNARLQQFHKLAAHDLREPLRTASGYVELILRRYEPMLEIPVYDAVINVKKTLQGMENLIDGIKSLSDLEMSSKNTKFCMRGAINDALANLNEQIKTCQANIVIDPMPNVIADRYQFTIVFQNLLSNAMKFCINTPEIVVNSRYENDKWVFSVSDNGIGIDKKHKERIFNMFTRLHSRQRFAGSGMGLAMCKTIVQRHGGEIRVISEGKGSTFEFSLPDIIDKKGENTMSDSPIRILLAEDNPHDAELVKAALDDTGLNHELSMVEDGEEVLSYLHQQGQFRDAPHPDLMLLDLNMPKLTGLELLDEIKDESKFKDIPIVLLTVSDDDDEVLKALELGMHYYIRKPINPVKLHNLLSAINAAWTSDSDEHFQGNNEVLYVLAGNPHTPENVLKRLSLCEDERVRAHLAENPSLNEELLTTLTDDKSEKVRMSVACHPSLPIHLLERLAKDASSDVRLEIAESPNLPESVRQSLQNDENPFVASQANKSSSK